MCLTLHSRFNRDLDSVSSSVYKMCSFLLPYHSERARSCLIWEAKQGRA